MLFRSEIVFSFIFILFHFIANGCTGGGQLTNDGAIQKDITSAVNDYNSDDWQIRLESVKRVSKHTQTIYAKNSLLLIIKSLEDSHTEIVIESLKILKQIKAPAAEEKIAFIAQYSTYSNVRFYALSALEEYKNIQHERIFLNGTTDSDWLIREAAFKGLLTINDPYVQTRNIDLITKAINNENISVRITVLQSINIRDPLIYDELAKIINDRESGLSILTSALQKIAGYTLDDKTKERVVELLTHRDKNIRLLSLHVLKLEDREP